MRHDQTVDVADLGGTTAGRRAAQKTGRGIGSGRGAASRGAVALPDGRGALDGLGAGVAGWAAEGSAGDALGAPDAVGVAGTPDEGATGSALAATLAKGSLDGTAAESRERAR